MQKVEAKVTTWVPKAEAREAAAKTAGKTKRADAIAARIARIQKRETGEREAGQGPGGLQRQRDERRHCQLIRSSRGCRRSGHRPGVPAVVASQFRANSGPVRQDLFFVLDPERVVVGRISPVGPGQSGRSLSSSAASRESPARKFGLADAGRGFLRLGDVAPSLLYGLGDPLRFHHDVPSLVAFGLRQRHSEQRPEVRPRVGISQRHEGGQRVDALGQVLPRRLLQLAVGGGDVEDVVRIWNTMPKQSPNAVQASTSAVGSRPVSAPIGTRSR